jgi:ATP-binding cassette subfamily B protein
VAVPSSITQGITVKGVTFGYRVGSDRVLDNVHMELPRGKIVALTGENGAGKSTLLRILGRLYDPTRGSVLLDGTDIRQFELDAFRSMVGVLFQDASSYFEPARENVRYGNLDGEHATPGAPRAVETAAREAGADAFISELPRGYDTVLGTWFDDGVELSIGQWKKIALARLFYSERPILLLDEPTSSLDAGSESNIMRQLREKVEDRVILVVSHRLSTVSAADLIYVLREGAIVEHGSHDALIRHDGAYAALCREQALT